MESKLTRTGLATDLASPQHLPMSITTISIGAYAVIAIPLAAALSIGQDEAYTLHTTGRDVAFAFSQAISFEQSAPLYFVLIAMWRHLIDSLFFVRCFSMLCIGGTLLLTPQIVRRYLPGADTSRVTAVLALNPVSLWAALEARPYAMIILLSALLLLVFYDAFIERSSGRRWRMMLLYAVLVTASLYTQYYLAFLIAAQGIALVIYARQALRPYAVACGIAAVAFAPLLVTLPGEIQNYAGPFPGPSSPVEALVTLIKILSEYVLPLSELGAKHVTYAIAAVAVIVAFVMARRSFTHRGPALILIVLGGSIVLFAIALYVERVHVLNRHLAFLYVPAVLSVFAVTGYFKEPARSRAASGCAVICVLLSIVALFVNYRALAKPGDWTRVAAYLQEHGRPGEPIAVFQAETALPFTFDYHGPNTVVAIPAAIDFRTYDVRRFMVRDERQLAQTMPSARRLWLIRSGDCREATIRFGCDLLERYIAERYRVASTAKFYRTTVLLLVAR
jgi:hypothetical protein